MAQKEVAGVTIDVNEEGYMTDGSQWTKDIAVAIAKEEEIVLADGHWEIIDFLRNDAASGKQPTIRRMKKVGGIDTKKFYELFPNGPLKKATKIAGLPKPASCV